VRIRVSVVSIIDAKLSLKGMHDMNMRHLSGSLLVAAIGISAVGATKRSDVAPDAYGVPAASYEVRIEPNAVVTMRDGIKLATDLYFPVGLTGKLPTILIRTPYNKSKFEKMEDQAPRFFAGQGYVVAVQDNRGKYASEGTFSIEENDPDDGYDTLSWIAKQPWSDGKVGMYGCSYVGEDQIELAKTRHPNLITTIPGAAGGAIGTAGNKYTYWAVFEGGVFGLSLGLGWFPTYGRTDNGDPKAFKLDLGTALTTLPVVDMIRRQKGPPSDFEDFVSHEPADPWWNRFAYIKDTDHFAAPSLQVSSWFDPAVAETLQLVDLMSRKSETAAGRDNQFAIIAPTTHCAFGKATRHTLVGQLDVGDARFPYWKTYLQWYDYWLLGKRNNVIAMPKIQYYLMGANEWQGTNEWPPKGVTYESYYLHGNGKANTRAGDGILSEDVPGNEASDSFTYDPGNPVQSRGGTVCCTMNPEDQPGAFDQSTIEDRPDILVYSTLALRHAFDVIGPVKVVLHVSSSARDTDFTAKLVDVGPDGSAFNVQEGIMRARYRDGYTKHVFMETGQIYEVPIDLHATAHRFQAHHRIRLEVSSSNFPRFVRNLNTGGNNYDETKWVIARNTIYHTAQHPSRIILPHAP
jgi:uncharacterized protein